jgi:hypothetical protein
VITECLIDGNDDDERLFVAFDHARNPEAVAATPSTRVSTEQRRNLVPRRNHLKRPRRQAVRRVQARRLRRARAPDPHGPEGGFELTRARDERVAFLPPWQKEHEPLRRCLLRKW